MDLKKGQGKLIHQNAIETDLTGRSSFKTKKKRRIAKLRMIDIRATKLNRNIKMDSNFEVK